MFLRGAIIMRYGIISKYSNGSYCTFYDYGTSATINGLYGNMAIV